MVLSSGMPVLLLCRGSRRATDYELWIRCTGTGILMLALYYYGGINALLILSGSPHLVIPRDPRKRSYAEAMATLADLLPRVP